MRHEEVRYKNSVEPAYTDGRDIDSNIGTLSGEGSEQDVKPYDERIRDIAPQAWDRIPRSSQQDPTYYDRPMLKDPVWSLDIPLYYYVGGAAGAALALGAAVQLAANNGDLRRFSKHCHWIGIIGSTAGAALLIHDLGKPSRFLHMMRVFRPTSPMNMGVWILSGAAPTAISAGVLGGRGGVLGALGDAAGYGSGVFGIALAAYTGVLVSNTAIPAWQEARRWMPILFAASAAASAGSILDLLYDDPRANRIAFLFGNVGRLAELAAGSQVEQAASVVPKVGEPYRKGGASTLWKAAKVLTAASLVVSVIPGKSPKKRRIAGILGTLGSLALRFAVHYIGNASAREPRASFEQQRARVGQAAFSGVPPIQDYSQSADLPGRTEYDPARHLAR